MKNDMALQATLHCLLGCMVGEMAGVTIGTHLGFELMYTILLAFTLAFISGYSFSTWPLVRQGMKFWPGLRLVFAADTLSILTMALADAALMMVIPGAMDKDLTHPVYWVSRVSAIVLAFLVAYPVNRALIARGKGHALTHSHHMPHDE